MKWLVAVALMSVAIGGCLSNEAEPDVDSGDEPVGQSQFKFVQIADGFDRPLGIVQSAGDDRLFIIEQAGKIQRLLTDGSSSTYGDISGRVGSGGNEQGLLGFAFHPDFATNGAVILSYTNSAGDSVLSRFSATNSSLVTDSEEILLTTTQPFANHNGGHILYGPDGMLYYGLGDGGLAGDPNANGQNPFTLLGSILRLDVGPTGGYTIPSDNPFASGGGAPEVWLYGLRNPWRFAFHDTDLWIGDVGQDAWEEVTRVTVDQGGSNLGWNIWEGTHQYPSGLESPVPALSFLDPVVQYANGGSDCSITGGIVAPAHMPTVGGQYLMSDFCSGLLRGTSADEPGQLQELMSSQLAIASFTRTHDDRILVADIRGSIHELLDS